MNFSVFWCAWYHQFTLYSIKKQRPTLFKDWFGKLSADSPDWYGVIGEDEENSAPPLFVAFVQVGSRVGYRWESGSEVIFKCEVNWLDPEPDRESSDYEKYIEELHEIERELDASIYFGFHQPPTEEEYRRRLWEDEIWCWEGLPHCFN